MDRGVYESLELRVARHPSESEEFLCARVLAFCLEQREGLAWTQHHDVGFSTMGLYEESRRHLLVTALKLLRRVDHV